jgi:hypothetical protein
MLFHDVLELTSTHTIILPLAPSLVVLLAQTSGTCGIDQLGLSMLADSCIYMQLLAIYWLGSGRPGSLGYPLTTPWLVLNLHLLFLVLSDRRGFGLGVLKSEFNVTALRIVLMLTDLGITFSSRSWAAASGTVLSCSTALLRAAACCAVRMRGRPHRGLSSTVPVLR